MSYVGYRALFSGKKAAFCISDELHRHYRESGRKWPFGEPVKIEEVDELLSIDALEEKYLMTLEQVADRWADKVLYCTTPEQRAALVRKLVKE